jgi:hypothetical protein
MHGQTARGPTARQPETRRRFRTTIILTAIFVVAAIVVSIAASLGVWWTVALIITALVVGPLIGLLMAGAAEDGRHGQVPEQLYEHPGIADRGPSDPASPEYDPAVDPNVPGDRP